MVFITFPQKLTTEEELLQQKYQKLKKKKRALQAHKAPKPETPPIQQLKRGSETSKKDAKELAKKLLKSGVITAIKVPDKDRQGQGFKRSKAVNRKRIGADKPGGYQPFSSVHSQDSDTEMNAISSSPGTEGSTSKSQYKNLYDSFVVAKDVESMARDETIRERRRDGKANYVNRDIPSTGNTIYVHGIGLTESILRTGFSLYGNIVNVNVESEKNCGFITFETIEQSNKAISEMNEKTVNSIKLKVSLSRRQPAIPSASTHRDINRSHSSDSWQSIAASYSVKEKQGHKDKRSLTSYDDIF